MGRPQKGQRVLGPYRVRDGRWQVILVEPGRDGEAGARGYRYFATEEEARRWRAVLEGEVVRNATTVDEAIDEYERHLTVDKGNKPRSTRETIRRLRSFVPAEDRELPLCDLGDAHGKRWYRQLVEAKKNVRIDDGTKEGRTEERPRFQVDSHRNYLAEARSFFAWCVAQRWARVNPLEHVKGVGRRRHGKAQLRIDEARSWLAKATELAHGGEDGAIAAMMTLLLGMRASEVVSRQVRDVDDGGRLLWIPHSKTEAGRRTLEVPEGLRDHLRLLAQNRRGDELLFKGRTGKGRGRADHRDRKWPTTWVRKIADLAGVQHVTSQSMRGLHASLAVDAGLTGHIVAASLGHESFTTTTTSYAKPEVTEAAKRRKSLKVLSGGKGDDET